MPFVTRLTLCSGDGELLEAVVSDLKERAARKGVELKGPHPKPPTRHSVPQYRGVAGDGTFGNWEYVVYTRVIEIVDHNEFAREVTEGEFPDRIHVAADVEQFRQAGSG